MTFEEGQGIAVVGDIADGVDVVAGLALAVAVVAGVVGQGGDAVALVFESDVTDEDFFDEVELGSVSMPCIEGPGYLDIDRGRSRDLPLG